VATLLLARHGETDWNREGRFQGQSDPPLNDLGRAQARALADRLARVPLAAVYASPLRRAYETAELAAAPHGLPVRSAPALREVDVGSWSGLTRREAEERFPAGYRRWLAYGEGWDDGETYAELAARVVPALLALAAAHDGLPVLAVTHGGPIRAAVAHAEAIDYAEARRTVAVVENCGLVRVAVEGGRLRLAE
jgi:probable phosphoglycerate mutase